MSQDQTISQYHELMQINAVSHLLRAARTCGLIEGLRSGQRTVGQLCQEQNLEIETTKLLIDALVAVGIIEHYGDDYALSPAAQLLCQYDDDLGDSCWNSLASQVTGDRARHELETENYFNHIAATQWIHTSAAIQAAEILNIGGDDDVQAPTILDLGCGSAVWSVAMAHRDSDATITAVDCEAALFSATSTAASIGMESRFLGIPGDPRDVKDLQSDFDLVLIAQRFGGLGRADQRLLLRKAVNATSLGGRIVIIDLFRGPSKLQLSETIEALKLHLETPQGSIVLLSDVQAMLQDLSLKDVQFTFLPASRINLGMVVAHRSG